MELDLNLRVRVHELQSALTEQVLSVTETKGPLAGG